MSSVVVTPTVDLTSTPPRVRLDVVDSTGPLYSATTVTRLNPDGTVVPVRTSDGNPLPLSLSGSTTVGLLYDYEAPFSAAVSYSTVESPRNVTANVVVPVEVPWLIHPGVPQLSMPVMLRPGTLQQETQTVSQGVFYPMGRMNPIVVNDGSRKGSKSSVTLMTQSFDELAAIRALVSDAGVLLFNLPADGGYGFDAQYIAVQDMTIARPTDVLIDGFRDITLPFVVVDRPAGGSTSARSLVDLMSFSSLAAIGAAYGTLTDVLAGP